MPTSRRTLGPHGTLTRALTTLLKASVHSRRQRGHLWLAKLLEGSGPRAPVGRVREAKTQLPRTTGKNSTKRELAFLARRIGWCRAGAVCGEVPNRRPKLCGAGRGRNGDARYASRAPKLHARRQGNEKGRSRGQGVAQCFRGSFRAIGAKAGCGGCWRVGWVGVWKGLGVVETRAIRRFTPTTTDIPHRISTRFGERLGCVISPPEKSPRRPLENASKKAREKWARTPTQKEPRNEPLVGPSRNPA
jgi:hypothetical protein